ncbi:MAG: AAA family ATPase [Porticoccaceae bacterium]
MRSTRFIAFYSHKGGVGRSLALANTAFALAAQGRKVLVMDMDLEAPGQHMTDLFRPGIAHRGDMLGWPGSGILEMFQEWQNWPERDAEGNPVGYQLELNKYLRHCREEVAATLADKGDAGGELWLLPAGDDSDSDAYAHRIGKFNWDGFYQSHGGAFLEWLRHIMRLHGFDDVLIDSRTGLSREFYVTTLELADTVVVVSGFNWQNIRGTRNVLERLRGQTAKDRYGDKRLLLVGSPVPTGLPPDYLARRLDDIRTDWRDFREFNVTLPYDAELALIEKIRSWEEKQHGWKSDYATAVGQLVELLNADVDPLTQALRQSDEAKPGNPFSLVRRDYWGIQDVVRYFIDPGEVLLQDMAGFTPLVITGARGTGKTMLASRFSLDAWLVERELNGLPRSPDHVQQIGLYFRIDADFLHSFNHGEDDGLRETFDKLFSLYFDIVVIRKALESLNQLGGIDYWCDVSRLFRDLTRQFGEKGEIATDYQAFVDFLEERLTDIRLYLNNPRRVTLPMLLPANALLKRLMEHLRRAGRFGERYFAILIDEYENYPDYQQQIVNTRLKQSRVDDGVTYRLFMRSGGLRTRTTLAPDQTIEEIHDYRQHSLDEGLDFDTFRHYAVKVANRHLEEHPWFAAHGHTDIEQLFQDLSAEDEARLLDKGRREMVLEKWLKDQHPAVADQFIAWFATEEHPLRRAVVVVLINQGKSADQVLAAFRDNSDKARDWYHNYHRGALHWLYRLYSQHKKYAGLNQIVGLSGNNVRVFLDFCQAIVAEWLATEAQELPIPYRVQDDAIHRQTAILRQNLYSAARSPREVNSFLERFGRLCELVHKSPRQSEPEINHFSIKDALANVEHQEKLDACLTAAWYEGVLRQLPGNKQKSLQDPRSVDWQLAPWLAPLFNLSTRRKKKLELPADDVKVLFTGSDVDWNKVFKRHAQRLEYVGSTDERQGELL